MNFESYEYKNRSARKGAKFEPIGMPTVCWKTVPAKTTKILSTIKSSILIMWYPEYFFLQSEYSFTKYVSSCPNTKYVYLRLPFLKMKDFRIILVSLFFNFNFWWVMIVFSLEKSKDLMFVIWWKVGDLRCSKNSLEFLSINIWFIPLLE